jgi:hypothetical protein
VSLVIPPGFGSAAFVFTGAPGTQPYVTTIGVDLGDAGGDWVAAANSAFVAYDTAFKTETSSALTLDHVTLTVGADGPGGSVDSTHAPSPGTRTGNFPPTALSAIARKTTNVLGRMGRGRMFIPGILSENEVDEDGSIVSARRTAVNTKLSTFFFELTSADTSGGIPLPPVLLHGPSSTPIPPTPITGLTVSDTVGWVRGRIR